MSYRTKQRLWSAFLHLMMLMIVAVCLFPVLWSCVISIKSVGEKVSGFHALSITQPTLANYERLFELIPLWQHLGISVFTRARRAVLLCGRHHDHSRRGRRGAAVFDYEKHGAD